MRKIPQECVATIGEVSNPEHNLAKLGKAGAKDGEVSVQL